MLNSFGKLTAEVKQGKEKYYDSRMWSMNGSKLDIEIKDIGNKLRISNKFWIWMFAICEGLRWKSCSFKCRRYCSGEMSFPPSRDTRSILNTSFEKKNFFILFYVNENRTSLYCIFALWYLDGQAAEKLEVK